MNKKAKELKNHAIATLGENADFLIITQENGEYSGITHGDADEIAQAIFALMHKENSPVGNALYRIVKLNAMNLLNNPSPYAADLSASIANLMSDRDE